MSKKVFSIELNQHPNAQYGNPVLVSNWLRSVFSQKKDKSRVIVIVEVLDD